MERKGGIVTNETVLEKRPLGGAPSLSLAHVAPQLVVPLDLRFLQNPEHLQVRGKVDVTQLGAAEFYLAKPISKAVAVERSFAKSDLQQGFLCDQSFPLGNGFVPHRFKDTAGQSLLIRRQSKLALHLQNMRGPWHSIQLSRLREPPSSSSFQFGDVIRG